MKVCIYEQRDACMFQCTTCTKLRINKQGVCVSGAKCKCFRYKSPDTVKAADSQSHRHTSLNKHDVHMHHSPLGLVVFS